MITTAISLEKKKMKTTAINPEKKNKIKITLVAIHPVSIQANSSHLSGAEPENSYS